MKEHFDLLGFKVRDLVTGVEGVADSLCFDLYGCVQYSIRPAATEKSELPEARWFDAKRLVAVSKKPVMPVPDFAAPPGPAEKPARSSAPAR